MIKIEKASNKELKSFGKKEWDKANIEHYGKAVDYAQKEFVYKATEDKKIIGSVKGDLEAGVLHISYLIVADTERGKGVGKSLMLKVEEFGKKFGAHKVNLETGKGWDAERFYKSLGYRNIAVLPKHHFKKDFVVYEKYL
jgi:GNAT superfamily N-acetyltransferase